MAAIGSLRRPVVCSFLPHNARKMRSQSQLPNCKGVTTPLFKVGLDLRPPSHIFPHFPRTIITMSLNHQAPSLPVSLCEECREAGPYDSVGLWEDTWPDLPKLLESACGLCIFVREIILSDEANLQCTAFGDATGPFSVQVWRTLNPKYGHMSVHVVTDLPGRGVSTHALWFSIHPLSGMRAISTSCCVLR